MSPLFVKTLLDDPAERFSYRNTSDVNRRFPAVARTNPPYQARTVTRRPKKGAASIQKMMLNRHPVTLRPRVAVAIRGVHEILAHEIEGGQWPARSAMNVVLMRPERAHHPEGRGESGQNSTPLSSLQARESYLREYGASKQYIALLLRYISGR